MYQSTIYVMLSPATRGLFCAYSLAPSDLNLDSVHYNHGFLSGNTNPHCQRGQFPPHKTHFNSTSSHYAFTLIETGNIFRGSRSFLYCVYDKAKAYACVWEMCSTAGWRQTVAMTNIKSSMVKLDVDLDLDVTSLNYNILPWYFDILLLR